MEKIEVGEYVRTLDGYIGVLVDDSQNVLNNLKIDVGREIRRDNGMSDHYIYTRQGFKLKHSKNLINLIEVGDIVEIKEHISCFRNVEKIPIFDIETLIAIKDGIAKYTMKIVSVLTKEQYEMNCYKVGGEDDN